MSQGIVGRVIASQQALVLGDIRTDPGYVEVVPGMASTVAVPLIHKKKPIGALNILSRDRDNYSERDATILRQFASHVATALVNAQSVRAAASRRRGLRDCSRRSAAKSRPCSTSISCSRGSRSSPERVIDYRTFGILLLNEANELEMKVAVQYGEKVVLPQDPARRRPRRLRGAAP